MGILDLFFPKRCVGCKVFGSYLCPICFSKIDFSTSSLCFVCNRPSLNGLTHPICKKAWTIDGISSSLVYSGVVKKLIYQFKYQPYLTALEGTLGELFYEGIIQHERIIKEITADSLLVPIPLFPAKERKRGYNQAKKLAEGIGERLGLEVVDLLVRKRQTNSQFSLDRTQRKTNMLDAFGVKEKKRLELQKSTIFLVDDVVTSGATMIEAAKVLKRSGAGKVYGITLAHGQ